MTDKQIELIRKRIALFECTWEDIQEAYPALTLKDAVLRATMEVFPIQEGAIIASKPTEEAWRLALYEIIKKEIPRAGRRLITKDPVENCHGYYRSPIYLDPWKDVLTTQQAGAYYD